MQPEVISISTRPAFQKQQLLPPWIIVTIPPSNLYPRPKRESTHQTSNQHTPARFLVVLAAAKRHPVVWLRAGRGRRLCGRMLLRPKQQRRLLLRSEVGVGVPARRQNALHSYCGKLVRRSFGTGGLRRGGVLLSGPACVGGEEKRGRDS